MQLFIYAGIITLLASLAGRIAHADCSECDQSNGNCVSGLCYCNAGFECSDGCSGETRPLYKQMNYGTLGCEVGYKRIDTSAACKAAADDLFWNNDFEVIETMPSLAMPRGCFRMAAMMSAPRIKWNPNVQDVATSNAAPICVRFSGNTCTATESPTLEPTKSPTNSPTTKEPTGAPTNVPTTSPTTKEPTGAPTNVPTTSPTTKVPTGAPTNAPTTSPTTLEPTDSPTSTPTALPTPLPTNAPTFSPTANSTQTPTASPTTPPTSTPTVSLTLSPTKKEPTDSPTGLLNTASPTALAATDTPTRSPTLRPSTSSDAGAGKEDGTTKKGSGGGNNASSDDDKIMYIAAGGVAAALLCIAAVTLWSRSLGKNYKHYGESQRDIFFNGPRQRQATHVGGFNGTTTVSSSTVVTSAPRSVATPPKSLKLYIHNNL